VRTLDALQVRAGNNQPTSFRAGSRYPIETGTYSSGISSSLLSGLGSAATAALQALGIGAASASATIPQIQYEDLGLTLKTTPQILRSGDVRLQFDLKIEALGGGTVNNIPILNNRTLTSTITVPIGQTALIASSLNRNETRSIEGLPGLSELPGFEGTEKNTEIDSGQLLITVTPHVVREGSIRVASRRLAYPTLPPE
jgi:type II secretory pathway component GspD/PulD (secretin)